MGKLGEGASAVFDFVWRYLAHRVRSPPGVVGGGGIDAPDDRQEHTVRVGRSPRRLSLGVFNEEGEFRTAGQS